MTKIAHKLILFLNLLAMTVTSSATSEAEYGRVSKAWTLHADGSQKYRSSMGLALFMHTAMNSTYGESFIIYNPGFQTLKIHSSYTRQRDGMIIKTPNNALVEVLPRFTVDAPTYNQLEEMVVVHIGLELGATIYLDYSIITKPGHYPALDINERLQEISPVKEYKVSTSIPEGTPLAYGLYGSPAKAVGESHDGIKEVHWIPRNIPASSRGAFQPKNREASPHLVASTYPSGKTTLTTSDRRLKEPQRCESKALAQPLTDKSGNEQKKMNITRDYILNNPSTCPIPMAMTDYIVRGIDTVLRSTYGTPLEIAQLLSAVLSTAGVPSEVFAVYPGHLDTDTRGLVAIQTLVVKAAVGGKDQYPSASPLTDRGGLDKVVSLSGTPIEVETTPIQVKESRSVAISADQAKDGFATRVLPVISAGIDSRGTSVLNSKRSDLFGLLSLIREEVTHTTTPAEGIKLQIFTKEQVMGKPFGKVTHTITLKRDMIEVVRIIGLSKQQFTPAEYSGVRSLIYEWTNPDDRVLLFSL